MDWAWSSSCHQSAPVTFLCIAFSHTAPIFTPFPSCSTRNSHSHHLGYASTMMHYQYVSMQLATGSSHIRRWTWDLSHTLWSVCVPCTRRRDKHRVCSSDDSEEQKKHSSLLETRSNDPKSVSSFTLHNRVPHCPYFSSSPKLQRWVFFFNKCCYG